MLLDWQKSAENHIDWEGLCSTVIGPGFQGKLNLTAPSSRNVVVLQSSQERAQQASGLEVLVEQPFSTDFRFSAPPRIQSIMPPATDPSAATPQGLGQPRAGPKGGAVLPLGEPAIMVACITAIAPCQVLHCPFQLLWLVCNLCLSFRLPFCISTPVSCCLS